MSAKDKDIHKNSFGERVFRLRTELSLSQLELAKKIGASKGTIQNYENNTLPKGEYAIKLARVFGCSIDWLLTGKNPHIAQEQPHKKKSQPSVITPEIRERMVSEHQELVTKFQDTESGREFNELLVELEALDKREYYMHLGYTKRLVIEKRQGKAPHQQHEASFEEPQKKIS